MPVNMYVHKPRCGIPEMNNPFLFSFFFFPRFHGDIKTPEKKTKILEIVYNNLRGMLKYQDAPEIFQQI